MDALIVSSIIFIITLIIIFSEKVDRTIVAMTGAALMVIVGIKMGFYTEEGALESIDFNTLGLLLGMMILVSILEPTGVFEYLAIYVGKFSKGKPIRLFVLLGAVTSVVSMFLDNVTTVVLIAPITILICEILGISVQPYLLAEALLSNVGGVSTLVGEPPNILIASAAGFSFNDFLIHSLPIVLVTWFVSLYVLLKLFKKDFANNIPSNPEAIMELNPGEAIKDRKNATRGLIMIGMAVLGFLFEEKLHVQPSMIALSAAAFGLFWVQPENLRETLNRAEWNILIFFASLFILVGGMQSAGVMQGLANIIGQGVQLPPVVLGVFLLWIVAILSAIVDNVPITIALIPVIQGLSGLGIDIAPLWWALAFGTGFGGNGTIIGSTANVIVTSLSERTRSPITPAIWSKRGLPVMLVSCAVASILYVGFYYVFGF
jgi:Na+/H+ antiporter NhaD/arsenite permease-like protein